MNKLIDKMIEYYKEIGGGPGSTMFTQDSDFFVLVGPTTTPEREAFADEVFKLYLDKGRKL